MDPLAHTLVGASLAETGLKRKVALGTTTLLIAANLPDIDGVCTLAGRDASLAGRRGHTHGVLAMVLLPLALAGAMYVTGRIIEARRQRRRGHEEPAAPTDALPQPPLQFRWLALLAFIGVLTHPLLDWMNSYGVRLLMPLSGRWFYGDALFIVDPVVWLLAAAPVVFARGHTKLAAAGWLLLLAAATAVVVVPKITPPPAKMLWCVGSGLLVYLRVRDKAPPSPRKAALICLPALALYLGFMLWGTGRAQAKAEAWLRARGLTPTRMIASPMPAQPLTREVVALVGDRYHFLLVDLQADAQPRPARPPLPRGQLSQAVRAALAAPQVAGFVNWARLPAYEEVPTANGTRVTLLDARYAGTRTSALGRATVELDHNLRVMPQSP